MHTHTHIERSNTKLRPFLRCHPSCFWDRVVHCPGTYQVAMFAGQWAPGACLNFPSMQVLPNLAFLWVLGIELMSSSLYNKHLPVLLFNVNELDEVLIRITMANDGNIQSNLMVFSFWWKSQACFHPDTAALLLFWAVHLFHSTVLVCPGLWSLQSYVAGDLLKELVYDAGGPVISHGVPCADWNHVNHIPEIMGTLRYGLCSWAKDWLCLWSKIQNFRCKNLESV